MMNLAMDSGEVKEAILRSAARAFPVIQLVNVKTFYRQPFGQAVSMKSLKFSAASENTSAWSVWTYTGTDGFAYGQVVDGSGSPIGAPCRISPA